MTSERQYATGEEKELARAEILKDCEEVEDLEIPAPADFDLGPLVAMEEKRVKKLREAVAL